MLSPHEILKRYWGYNTFRSSQLEVIHSILEGKDTLVLMPTGGGKSLCFQVPSMMMEGICIVISPLIALMSDQVNNLKSKQIRAIAISSAMTPREVDIALDNCIYGDYKFLYLSPERLENEVVRNRLQKMNINIIAVDESHCISEWGYDFRPSYLKIAQIRSLTQAAVIALTASATEKVVEDIQEKLQFKSRNVIKSSFYRDELSYVVLKHEDKDTKLLHVLNKVKGSAIVYCNTRKETKRLHLMLKEHGISSHYYHAGLDILDRDSKQKQWLMNHVRVMVATNAFGMGIDKADVRLVVHNFLPYSLEAYYQEVGRAGRDQKLAYAIMITNRFDADEMNKKIEDHFPEINEIRTVYQQLANHFGLATGSGQFSEFPFEINEFCEKYSLNYLKTYNILKLLEKEDILKLSPSVNQPSRIYFKISNIELYQFQIANKKYDILLKILLRSYASLFDTYVKIQESIIAKRAQINTQEVKDLLSKLHQMDIIDYIPQNSHPKILFLKERIDTKRLIISKETLEKRKNIEKQKSKSVIQFINNNHICRSSFIQSYFGEKNPKKCGKCDVCLDINKLNVSNDEFENITSSIKKTLINQALTVDELIMKIVDFREDKMIEVLQFLSDNGHIAFNEHQQLYWKS